MSKLTTLNYMLTQKLAAPGEMAYHIEQEGIFSLDKFGNYKQHRPATVQANEALAGIAVFLQHEKNPPSPEYETWYLEQDPTYHYGWPDGGVPVFGKTDFIYWSPSFDHLTVIGNLFRKDIMTVGRLLLLNMATPGEISQAIDRVGIWGFDRYANLVQIDKVSHHGLKLHDVLTSYAEFYLNGQIPENSIFNAQGFRFYGWPHDQVPDFKNLPATKSAANTAAAPAAIPSVSVVSARAVPQDDEAKVSPQGAKSFHIIIASLLSMIRGDMTGKPHPDWETQNQLIASIEENLKKTYGTSDSNLRKKFSAANKVRPLLGLPLLDDEGNPVV